MSSDAEVVQYVSGCHLTRPKIEGFDQLQQEKMVADYITDIEEAIGKEALWLIV